MIHEVSKYIHIIPYQYALHNKTPRNGNYIIILLFRIPVSA